MPITLFIHPNQSVNFTDELRLREGKFHQVTRLLHTAECFGANGSALQPVESLHNSSGQDLLRPVNLTFPLSQSLTAEQ